MWFWYAFISALASGVSITLNKKALKNLNASLVTWALFFFSFPFLFYPAFKDGLPKVNTTFFIMTTSSAILFTLAKTISLRSIKNSHLSEIIPLTSFSIFFNYILGILFLSENLKLIPLVGLFLIIIGVYVLKVKEAREDLLRPFKLLITNKDSLVYMIAMFIMPFTSVLDKIGLRKIEPVNQSFLLFYENLIIVIILTFYMTKRDKKWTSEFKGNFWVLFMNGFIYTVVALSFYIGITSGAIALVSGIKKLEVLFVLLLSWLIFKDKPKKEIWIGSLIMLAGVILIKIG
jgi:uncharacterized membrane protein